MNLFIHKWRNLEVFGNFNAFPTVLYFLCRRDWIFSLGYYTKSQLFRRCCETTADGDGNEGGVGVVLWPLCDYRALLYLAAANSSNSHQKEESPSLWWARISPDGSRDGDRVRTEELAPIVRCANEARDHRKCCRRAGLLKYTRFFRIGARPLKGARAL